jgi:hypothetical protein
MSHHHHSHDDHPHHHDHPPQDPGREPSAGNKLAMVLEHWIKHNEHHARAYQEWARTASTLSMQAVAAGIEEAVELTLAANRKFEEALRRVREQR